MATEQKILLIEDNPGDARLIQEMLAEAKASTIEIECLDNLSDGLERLSRGGIDLVLLDLLLPDSQGIETFTSVYSKVSGVPIIVLSVLDDEALAVEAVKQGAQDYLVKGQFNGNLLACSIRYAIERQRLLRELEQMMHLLSFVDDLTGLYNRRGFSFLAQQQLKLAERTKRAMFLFFADLDGMKWINDTLGHQEGDRALKETAEVLKETFRESDIIARMGGDEFVILVVEASGASAESVVARLQKNLEAHNTPGGHRQKYKLSLSLGVARFNPEHPCSIEELMAQADTLMYRHKGNKRQSYEGGDNR